MTQGIGFTMMDAVRMGREVYGMQPFGLEQIFAALYGADGRHLVARLVSEYNEVQIADDRTGAPVLVARISYPRVVRATEDGGLVDLIQAALGDWRKRLYDYDPVAEGLYEGDLL